MSTFEMYQQVRKLNPDLYYDTKTQKQMREDAKRLGDAFFTQQLFDFMEVRKWYVPPRRAMQEKLLVSRYSYG